MAAYSYAGLQVVVTAKADQAAREVRSKLTGAGEDAAKGIQTSMSRGFSGLGRSLAPVAKSAANVLGLATAAAAAFGVSSFRAAARVGEMDASLRALAKANKQSYPEMQRVVGEIRKQGIEAGVAQGVVAQFSRNQLKLADSTKLARVAQDAAVISGRNSTEVLDDLIHGITTQNSLVLRNAGVNVQAGQAVAAYAKQLGKNANELTSSERAQAVLNATLAEGSKVAGAYEAAMKEPGKVLRSFRRVVDDIKVSVGQGLVQAFGPLIIKTYELVKAFSVAVGPGGRLAPLFTAIGVAAQRLVAPVTKIIERVTKWVEALDPKRVDAMSAAVKRFAVPLGAAAAALVGFAGKNVAGRIPVVREALSSIMPVVSQLKGAFLSLSPAGQGLVAVFALLMAVSPEFRKAVLDLVGVLFDALKPVLSVVMDTVKELMPVIRDLAKAAGVILAGALRAVVIPAVKVLAAVLSVIAPIIKPLIYAYLAWKIATIAMTVAQIALNVALLANPIGIVIIAIAAIVGAVVLAYKHFGWFRAAVQAVWAAMKAFADFIVAYVWPVIKVMIALYLLPWIVAIKALMWAWNNLRAPVTAVISAISGALSGAWNATWAPVVRAFDAVVRALGNTWRTIWQSWIAPAMRGIGAVVSSVWNATLAPVFRAISAGTRAIGDAFRAMQRVIASAMGTVVNAVRGPLRGAAFQVINPFLRGANALLGKIGLKIPLIPSFAAGGKVPGYGGGDILPALLEPGEAIVPKHLARGRAFSVWARAHRLPGYQEGGLVHGPGGGTFGVAPAWNPVNWATGLIGKAAGGFGALFRMAKDDLIDPFFKLIRAAAFEVFKKAVGPIKKPLEAMTKAAVPPFFFSNVAGKLGIKAIDGLVSWMESKVAPEFGGVGVDELAKEVMRKFPSLRVTSALRPGDPGYHGKGWARDLGGPVGVMNQAGRWMQSTMVSALLEGIHNPSLSVKNYKIVSPGFWGAGTWAGHADHIHMAADPGRGGASFSAGGMALRGIVDRIARQFGVPGLVNLALQRIQVESGGNARAVNNWDINAQRGYPSTGLAQIIRPTFQAYCGPYCRTGPFLNGVSIDPVAQVYTMFRYSIARYGKAGLAGAWGGRQGYAEGGVLWEPVVGIGLRTGTPYSFGERGPELVSPLARAAEEDWQTARRPITVNVYPQRGQSETEVAAAVSRRLHWAQATGKA